MLSTFEETTYRINNMVKELKTFGQFEPNEASTKSKNEKDSKP